MPRPAPSIAVADNAALVPSSSPLSRPWYPGQALPPRVRPPRALLEASMAAAARAGVSAPLPAAMGAEGDDSGEGKETLTHGGEAREGASATLPATEAQATEQQRAPARPQRPPPSSCAPPSPRGGEETEQGPEYPLAPVDDAARSALVDEILKACEPGDPVLAAICRLLKSVLGVPMASVTLISHAQAWFRGGEGGAGGGAGGAGAGGGGGGGGGIGGSCAASAAAAAEAASSSASNSDLKSSSSSAAATSCDPDPMPRGRVLCAYSLIGEPDVRRERGRFLVFFFYVRSLFLCLSLARSLAFAFLLLCRRRR